jgi:hypothetical protein
MPDMTDNQTAPETVRVRLREALKGDVRVTPLCRAIMGWLCEAPTVPSVAEIRVSGDGRVWLRLSDEAYPEPTGTFLEFLEQIRVLCLALGISEEQTRQAVGWAQFRLF